MSLKRIEIYLSEGSPEDMELYSLWKTLSAQGRGRAQNVFRSALMSLIESPTDITDTRTHVLNKQKSSQYGVMPRPPQKRGPKKSWHPEKNEVQEPIHKQPNSKRLDSVSSVSEPLPVNETVEPDTNVSGEVKDTIIKNNDELPASNTLKDEHELPEITEDNKDRQDVELAQDLPDSLADVVPPDVETEKGAEDNRGYHEDSLEGLKLEEDKSVVPIFIPKNKKETDTGTKSDEDGETRKSRFASLF